MTALRARASRRPSCALVNGDARARCAGEARLLAALLTSMDGVHARREATVVVAATNRPHALDPALRRPGRRAQPRAAHCPDAPTTPSPKRRPSQTAAAHLCRFDREIEVGVPGEASRRRILAALFARAPHALAEADLDEVARRTAGFVGADLAALHRHAALAALSRSQGVAGRGDAGRPTASGAEEVRWADVLLALTQVGPSALRELELQVPHVSWDDIGGQHELKTAMREAVQWPLQHADAFARMGVRPPRGVLLYGPPGCSKTLAAKATRTRCPREPLPCLRAASRVRGHAMAAPP